MKFLLWQYAAYVGVAMLVGVALGIVLAQSTHRLQRLHAERLERSLAAAEARIARLREERARDDQTLSEAKTLTSRLTELHGALALVEADVRANQIGRAEAERARDEALNAAERARGDASRMRQAEFELTRTAAQLAEVRAALHDLQRTAGDALARSEAETATARAALAQLQRAHDAAVSGHQQQLSAARVSLEEAVSLNRTLQAEIGRLGASAGDGLVIDLREDSPVVRG